MNCPLCQRVQDSLNGEYPFLIHEFENSFLYLGEHQYYRGYCVLVSKSHHKEMSDIPSPERELLFKELMNSSQIIQRVFRPKKMNLSSYGNVVEHLHWHLFPRYEEDKDFQKPPFLQMDHFDNAKTSPDDRDALIRIMKIEIKSASLF